jgi:hypothetical protein
MAERTVSPRRTALTAVLLGASVLFALRATTLPPWAALLLVPLSVAAAILVAEDHTLPAVATGSLAALLHALVGPALPLVAGALWAAAVFAPRASRAQSRKGSVLVGAVAALGGLLGSWVTLSYIGEGVVQTVAAFVVTACLVSAALVLPVDDAVAHGLLSAAGRCPDPARAELLRALFLRRRVSEGAAGVEAATAGRLEEGWRSLWTVARARPTASEGAAKHLDARLKVHVDALERVYSAAAERAVRASGLTDPGLVAVGLEGDALELEVVALDECVRQGAPAARA